MPKNVKRWSLNENQFVQSKGNKRITYRQTGGKNYHGISLTPLQFRELDKLIVGSSMNYFVHFFGKNIYFSHPRDEVYTLWKQSKKHPSDDVAFFRFNLTSWQQYLNDIHSQIKSLLSEDVEENSRHV